MPAVYLLYPVFGYLMNMFLIIRIDPSLKSVRFTLGEALENSNDERYYDYRRAYHGRHFHSCLCYHVYT